MTAKDGSCRLSIRSSNEIVSYLTPLSDLDLAPETDQFVASPPVRYINPGCYVNVSLDTLQRVPDVVKI